MKKILITGLIICVQHLNSQNDVLYGNLATNNDELSQAIIETENNFPNIDETYAVMVGSAIYDPSGQNPGSTAYLCHAAFGNRLPYNASSTGTTNKYFFFKDLGINGLINYHSKFFSVCKVSDEDVIAVGKIYTTEFVDEDVLIVKFKLYSNGGINPNWGNNPTVMKLNIGGGIEKANRIICDKNTGECYLTGFTQPANPFFPNFGKKMFVQKLDASLNQMWSRVYDITNQPDYWSEGNALYLEERIIPGAKELVLAGDMGNTMNNALLAQFGLLAFIDPLTGAITRSLYYHEGGLQNTSVHSSSFKSINPASNNSYIISGWVATGNVYYDRMPDVFRVFTPQFLVTRIDYGGAVIWQHAWNDWSNTYGGCGASVSIGYDAIERYNTRTSQYEYFATGEFTPESAGLCNAKKQFMLNRYDNSGLLTSHNLYGDRENDWGRSILTPPAAVSNQIEVFGTFGGSNQSDFNWIELTPTMSGPNCYYESLVGEINSKYLYMNQTSLFDNPAGGAYSIFSDKADCAYLDFCPVQLTPKSQPLGMRNNDDKPATSGSFYPNPATDFIKSNIESGSFIIFDLAGRIVMKNDISKGQIDISGLDRGIYIISFYDDETLISTEKLIKK